MVLYEEIAKLKGKRPLLLVHGRSYVELFFSGGVVFIAEALKEGGLEFRVVETKGYEIVETGKKHKKVGAKS